MPSKYYLTLTTYGSDLIAQAHESAPLNLKNLVIGDANGVPYDPLTAIDRTHLVNQKASVLIQHIQVIEDVIRVTATIGAQIGGFNIHEIGLTDETDQLIYIGNFHGGYKSVFEEGAGGEITISIDIKGTAANNINLSVDPNINTATQEWIIENYIPRDELVNNLTTDDPKRPVSAAQAKKLQDDKLGKNDLKDASTTVKGIVQLNNTLGSASTTQVLTAAQGKVLNDQAFGVGQTWQDVTSSRVANTTYTNSTSKPITVLIRLHFTGGQNNVFVGGVDLGDADNGSSFGDHERFVVPPGLTYKINSGASLTINKWMELR